MYPTPGASETLSIIIFGISVQKYPLVTNFIAFWLFFWKPRRWCHHQAVPITRYLRHFLSSYLASARTNVPKQQNLRIFIVFLRNNLLSLCYCRLCYLKYKQNKQQIITDTNRYFSDTFWLFKMPFPRGRMTIGTRTPYGHVFWVVFREFLQKKRANIFFSQFLKIFLGNQESDALFDPANGKSDPKNIKTHHFQNFKLFR